MRRLAQGEASCTVPDEITGKHRSSLTSVRQSLVFDRIRQNLRSQRAGANAIESVASSALTFAPSILQAIDSDAKTMLAHKQELAAQLLAIFFFDYVVENVVKQEVKSPYFETSDEDFKQFIHGARISMERHLLFGPIGVSRAEGLRDWITSHIRVTGQDVGQEAYECIFGTWFLKEMGEVIADEARPQIVGRILTSTARELYTG
jgi:hypothetical protein